MSQAYTEWIVPARFMASAADPPINPIPITASFNPGSLCGGELREKLLQGGKEPFILIGRTDGDTTAWFYDEATGLELKKTYADGSSTIKTYDKFNRLEILTKARGIVTTYAYAPLTGELVSVSHNDNTPGWEFTYNHLGQITSVRDASGIRECSYDAYGRMTQDTSLGTVESSIQEQRGWNLYAFIRNRINIEVDLLGTIPPYNGGASGIVEVPIPQSSIIESN